MALIRAIRHHEIEPARRLLLDNGWAHRVADADAFEAMVRASTRTAVALVDGRVAGFGRALCDGVSNGYVSMVAVDAAHRRCGIGRGLVERVMGVDPAITRVLRAGRAEEAGFVERLEFSHSTMAMERSRRSQAQAPGLPDAFSAVSASPAGRSAAGRDPGRRRIGIRRSRR